MEGGTGGAQRAAGVVVVVVEEEEDEEVGGDLGRGGGGGREGNRVEFAWPAGAADDSVELGRPACWSSFDGQPSGQSSLVKLPVKV